MSLARLACRLKAHAYVSQPLSHVLTTVHTHPALYMCANNHTQAFCAHLHTHTRIYTLVYACIHVQAVLGP